MFSSSRNVGRDLSPPPPINRPCVDVPLSTQGRSIGGHRHQPKALVQASVGARVVRCGGGGPDCRPPPRPPAPPLVGNDSLSPPRRPPKAPPPLPPPPPPPPNPPPLPLVCAS